MAAPEVAEEAALPVSGIGLVVVAFATLGFLFVAFDGERGTADLPVAPSMVTAPTLPPATIAASLAVTGYVRVERVPVDHEPTVSGAPGPGVPLLGAETDMALLYVNSIGRPTLIDLDTGQRREIEISPLRRRDSFLIEHGDVVGTDREYLASAPATDRAIRVEVERPGRTAQARSSPISDGPVLCLGSRGCPQSRWTQTTYRDGTDTVATLDAGGHPDVAELFDLTDWTVDGRWLLAPDRLGLDFRIPAPSPTATVWVIHQPDRP